MKLTVLNKRGFSLAEALVTLLIVCLITIAMMPILTKKKRNLSNSEHGMWMCTLNSAGQHVYWSKESENGLPDNPETWTVAGDSCSFKPTAGARNFYIQAVGGGAGGGAGEFTFLDKYSGGNSFTTSVESDYRVLVVGGGGGGGSKTDDGCDNKRGYGGGTGGFYEGVHRFYPGVNYAVSTGGGGNYDSDDKDDGGNSGAKAYNGSESSVISNSGGNLYLKIQSTGGEGGRNYIKDGSKCKISDFDAGGERAGYTKIKIGQQPERDVYQGVEGNRTSNGTSAKITATSFIAKLWSVSFANSPKKEGSSASTNIGYGFGGYAGGNYDKDFDKSTREIYSSCGGSERCWGQQGGDGVVKIVELASYLGKNGEAGELESTFVPEFNKKELPLKVVIGKSGIGGLSTESSDSLKRGQDGERTVVGDGLIVSAGGRGGTNKYEKITEEREEISGHNGENSPVDFKNDIGGKAGYCSVVGTNYKCKEALLPLVYQFGAGGGGGAAGYKVTSSSGTNFHASNGSSGRPGVVIIKW